MLVIVDGQTLSKDSHGVDKIYKINVEHFVNDSIFFSEQYHLPWSISSKSLLTSSPAFRKSYILSPRTYPESIWIGTCNLSQGLTCIQWLQVNHKLKS
jgi:hypothetical protein